MLTKCLSIMLVAAAVCGSTFAVETPSGVQIKTTRPGAKLKFERGLKEGKVLVGVADAKQQPVLGLTVNDFTVTRADGAGKVVDVEPITESAEVLRHTVLVLDNSYSIVQRNAVEKLLGEVGVVLEAIRPIDDVHMVVLGKPGMQMGGRKLRVKTFQSNDPSELEAYAVDAYTPESVTGTTRLYEGMLAGIELLRGTPANDQRFLMIFSDGAEMNSAFTEDVVIQAAKEIPNLHVYAIDCMPGQTVDPFMASFARENDGQAWEAGTGAALPALFQQSGTKQAHYYAVSYQFAPPPAQPTAQATPLPPAPTPKTVVFEHAALFDFGKANLKPEGMEQLKNYREQARADLSSANKVKIVGHTDNVGSADYNMKLSLLRAEAVRDFLLDLGVAAGVVEVDGEGLSKPVADNSTPEGRAKNRRVEVAVSGTAR